MLVYYEHGRQQGEQVSSGSRCPISIGIVIPESTWRKQCKAHYGTARPITINLGTMFGEKDREFVLGTMLP